MTHDELVARAVKWLTNTMKCIPVYSELNSWMPTESPDAIGWRPYDSILVECKTSLSDFYRDKSKWFRQPPERGVGVLRIYMTPPGLLQPKQLPEHWGLVECRAKIVKVIVKASPFPEISLRGEIQLLRAAAMNGRQDHSLIEPGT